VYFLHGEEDFLIERAVNALRAAALDGGEAAFNSDVFYGSENSAEDIVSTANAFPVMAQKRVVVVREAEKLFSSTALGGYILSPAPETVLILTAEKQGTTRRKAPSKKSGSRDVQAALAEAVKKGVAGILEYKALRDAAAQKWIVEEFRAAGKSISTQACTIFHALKGNSAREISSEVEKIVSALGESDTVEADDVYYYLGASKQYNVFEFTNTMLARDTRAAIEIGMRLLDTESLAGIIAMLIRQYVTLWRIRSLQIRGRCTDEQARSVGLAWGWQAENLRAFLPKYPDPSYFEQCFEYLLMADIAVKTQVTNDAAVLTKLIHQLTATDPEQ
jgi:DNA polymerase-3 subunit delta